MKTSLRIPVKSILVYLIILIITLEISPFLAGPVFLGEKFSRSEIKRDLQQKVYSQEEQGDTMAEIREGYLSEHMVHPYLGFVHQPDHYYNAYGFPADTPLPIRSGNMVNVCITGGSVAKQLFQFSGDELKTRLKALPIFHGHEINLYCIALGGFKQPQQMLAMNYFLSLGAEYDYVINIDGFNEVVLPYSDNLPFGIFPVYPRHWNVYSRKVLDKGATLLIGKQAVYREKQQRAAEEFSGSVFRFSNFGLFIWKLRDQQQAGHILEAEEILRAELMANDMEWQTRGPEYPANDTALFLLNQVRYWAQCSRQIHALAGHFGFKYLHFLQPNQYYKGSKELTQEELEIAFEAGDFAYKTAAGIAYPMLVEEGQKLTTEGMNFSDLTQLFASEKTTVYSDKCCHFNKRGYDAIVQEIVHAISSLP